MNLVAWLGDWEGDGRTSLSLELLGLLALHGFEVTLGGVCVYHVDIISGTGALNWALRL